MLDLAGSDQLFHSARDILDRHVWVDAMLIQKIDVTGLQPFERGVNGLLDMLRPAVETSPFPGLGIDVKADLVAMTT